MSRPVWRTASSEEAKRRVSPISAQIATEVIGPIPKWVVRSARQPGWRREKRASSARSGSSSPVSRSSCRRPTSTASRPAGDSSAAVRRAWPAALVREATTGTPWWYRVAWTRCSHAVRSSSKSLYSRTLIQPHPHTAAPSYSRTLIQPHPHTAAPSYSRTLIQPHPRPGLKRMRRWDPRLGQVALHQQLPQVAGVGPIGLGAALAASLGGRLRRLGQMGPDAGPLQLLHHIPPAGTALHRESHLTLRLEPGQEGPKVATVGRDDTTPIDLAGDHIQIVVGELAPVQIEPPYDGHAGPPRAPTTHRPRRVASARRRPLPYSRLLRLCRGGPPTFHLVAVAVAAARLVHVSAVGIHHADDPIGGDLTGDPEAPRLLARLDILAGDHSQQPDRLRLLAVQLGALQLRQHDQRVTDQPAHQLLTRGLIIPGAGRLAGPMVIVVGSKLERGRGRHQPPHP